MFNPIILMCVVFAIALGVKEGIKEIRTARIKHIGFKDSDNIFKFLFIEVDSILLAFEIFRRI
jgi:hypothetical protein